MRHNRNNQDLVKEERLHLKPLPLRRSTDYDELTVRVSRSSTINVKHVVYSAGELLQELRKARAQLKLNELRLKLYRYRMRVMDEPGYVKRDSTETGVLFELIAHHYECGSLVITSNHPFSM